MGRHSRRGPAGATGGTSGPGVPPTQGAGAGAGAGADARPGPGPGTGRRRRASGGEDTPAHGTPQATPPHGVPEVRGGHPEQREPGGGWGDVSDTASGPRIPGPRQDRSAPRQDYMDAFPGDDRHRDDPNGDDPHRNDPHHGDPYASVTDWNDVPEPRSEDGSSSKGSDSGSGSDAEVEGGRKIDRTRVLTGIAAAAVTFVLGVVMAGQVTGGGGGSDARPKAAPGGGARDTDDPASRSDERPAPLRDPAEKPDKAPVTYDQKMGEKYPLDAKLKASGDFEAIAGFDKAPGKGQLFRYRVDVEKGLGLDGPLFAQAVQKTLNDDRSWAHGGARAFERISSGKPDFVITLASPGTTAAWCAKSGLDTTQDNVSCDSAATDRVMINAYRWAQGAKTYGDEVKKEFGNAIHPYRQMLINHEVGHRLGFNHTDCTKDGDLAPVMQQQTKFLEHDGIKCKANPWAFPKS
ncbi:hypothetical protein DMA15_24785 [Streptomyces sp. WAC 01529]|uniref:DUF3152 domain-containing protein n=1 Tax=Streptomyces sp. WAC 01529 TaxID=2203205 RepID=UPI000F6F41C6|nr:DUF3152 domain-containing protein [Streptomyces sp. WAC 01529]AZM55387.1 hypothetical protein DMA15_24785 [Streptomyces sp. WAC 01529]